MIYTLDTNTITAILRQNTTVIRKIQQAATQNHHITLNAISYFETKRGLLANVHQRKIAYFENLCQQYRQLDIDKSVLDIASDTYQYLRQQGNPLEDADILVASIAIANDAILVSRNHKHLARIPKLKLENWQDSDAPKHI